MATGKHRHTKTLLITGGNNGIGLNLVRQWLEDGGKAAVLDLETGNLAPLKEQFGQRLLPIICDCADQSAMEEAVRQAADAFGAPDCAIHNACVCPFKTLDELEPDDYRRVMGVNFLGAVHLTKAVLPFMLARKSGRILFTSSGVGVTGFTGISAYAASKGAIEAFARCMRLEYLHSGVTFHLLHPPLTDTKSSEPLPVPREFKANAEKVGRGFARRLTGRRFVIAPSAADGLQIRMSYLMPLSIGGLLAKMTAGAKEKQNDTRAE